LSFGLKRGWAFPVAPEWWAFFTRDPTEGQPLVFRPAAGGKWVSAIAFPNGSSANLLGFRRKGRGQGVDLEQILIKIPPSAWRSCQRATPVSCLERDARALEIDLDVAQPELCGRLGIMRLRPIPWELAKQKGAKPTADVVMVAVRCTRA
jgi:antimicrobial peptide system SdpA family protein